MLTEEKKVIHLKFCMKLTRQIFVARHCSRFATGSHTHSSHLFNDQLKCFKKKYLLPFELRVSGCGLLSLKRNCGTGVEAGHDHCHNSTFKMTMSCVIIASNTAASSKLQRRKCIVG
jgi:hypothetical protein